MADVEENPPDNWEDCEGCGGCHPPTNVIFPSITQLQMFDCRNDLYRWPSEASIAALKANPNHGYPTR